MGVSVRGSRGERGNVVLDVGLDFFDSVGVGLLIDCLLVVCLIACFVGREPNGQPMGMASRCR